METLTKIGIIILESRIIYRHDGINIAIHHGGKKTSAFTIDRQAREEEINEMGILIKDYLGVKASYNYCAVCMYTNTR